jgi:aconitate hydratase
MFIGATNAFVDEIGATRNQETGLVKPVPDVAREYKAAGQVWCVVGDENYGEGSSREHAAMCPRHLGAAAVIVRSFARIHETNLKKQGVLPFTFADAADWAKVQEADKVSLDGLDKLAPGSDVTAVFTHADGTADRAALRHTLNAEQIVWWQAGSALNSIRS